MVSVHVPISFRLSLKLNRACSSFIVFCIAGSSRTVGKEERKRSRLACWLR